MENKEYGLVYGLTNPYFEGLVKIGATRNLDINKRMRVLGTAVPAPFECAFAYKIPYDDLFGIEHILHKTYGYCRIEGSEFFKITPCEVDNLLRTLGKFEPMKTAVQEVIDTEEAKRKKPNMDFIKMGLSVGDIIFFKNDPAVTCTIANNKKVIYKGGTPVSLSSLTHQLLGTKYAVQPSPYWQTKEGILLTVLYAESLKCPAQELTDTCTKGLADLTSMSQDCEIIISSKI